MGSTFWPIIVLPTDAGLSAIAIEDLSPRYRWIYRYQGVYGEFIWVGFLGFCFLHTINPHKVFYVGKSGSNRTFIRLFWGWVGLGLDRVGFIIKLTCFPSQHNNVFRKHPTLTGVLQYDQDKVYFILKKRIFGVRNKSGQLLKLA